MESKKKSRAQSDKIDTRSYDEVQRAKGGYSTTVLGPNLPTGQAGFPRGYDEKRGEYGEKLQSGNRHKSFIKRGV